MAKYRCITRLQTKDEKIHEVGDIVEMDDEEGATAVRLDAAVLVEEEVAQDTATPFDTKSTTSKPTGKTTPQSDTAVQPTHPTSATDTSAGTGSDVK